MKEDLSGSDFFELLTKTLTCNPLKVGVGVEVESNHLGVVLDIFTCRFVVWVELADEERLVKEGQTTTSRV